MVPQRGPQVLGNGEQVASCRPQVRERARYLVPFLAQAEDQVRLGDEAGLAGPGQHIERTFVTEARAYPPEDARHGFDVVRENLRTRGDHLRPPFGIRIEVRHKTLAAEAWHG